MECSESKHLAMVNIHLEITKHIKEKNVILNQKKKKSGHRNRTMFVKYGVSK